MNAKFSIPLLYSTIIMIAFFTGCHYDNTVPSHLIGVWETSEPKFKDRYIKFTENFLIFGIGSGDETTHPIQDIEIEEEINGIRYTFHYLDGEGKRWKLIFNFFTDGGGIIQLQHRDEVWEKVE